MTPHPPTSTLFPYTTLFRSGSERLREEQHRGRDPVRPRPEEREGDPCRQADGPDRKSTRLNSSHVEISYAVFCLKKKTSCRTRASIAIARSSNVRNSVSGSS